MIQNMTLKSRKRSLVPVLTPQAVSSSKFTSNIVHSTTVNINGKEFTNSHCEELIPSSGGIDTSSAVIMPRLVKIKIETDIPEMNKISNRELLISQSRKSFETENREQDDKSGEGKENKVSVIRENYDRWKEGIEKKRKLLETI